MPLPRKTRLGIPEPPKKKGKKIVELPISAGVPVTYVVCPVCSQNRVLERTSDKSAAKDKLGFAEWDNWDPETSPIIQIRVGGGRGSGFKHNTMITWKEAEESGLYNEHLEEIRKQLRALQPLIGGGK